MANKNNSTRANPTIVLIVSACMGLVALAGGVFLTLRGDTALGSAMIGAVIAAFFQHTTQTLSNSSSMATVDSITSAVLNAVETGKGTVTASTAVPTASSAAPQSSSAMGSSVASQG